MSADQSTSRDAPQIAADELRTQDEDFRRRIEELYRAHNDALVGLVYHRLHSYVEARDVAHEAYVRLLQLDKPGAISLLQAWLFRTAINLAQDRLRRRRVRERDAHLLYDPDHSDAPSAEQLCIQEEESACVRRAVEQLPPKCRQAFTLVQFHGRRYCEVAAQMGVTEAAARQLVCRAIEHLANAVVGAGRAKRRRVSL